MKKKLIIIGYNYLSHEIFKKIEKKIDIHIIFSHRELIFVKNNKLLFETLKKNRKKIILLKNIDNFLNNLKKKFTVILSIGSTFLIKDTIIKKFKPFLFNCHNTPLPNFRGGANSTYRLMNNNLEGATTIHFLTKTIDAGNILLQKRYKIPEKIDLPYKLDNYIMLKALPLLCKFIIGVMKSNKLKSRKQKNMKSSYFPRLNTEIHGCINWDWEADDIKKFVKSFSYPYKGAFCYIGKNKVKILNCKIKEKNKFNHPFMNGIVHRIDKLNYYVLAKKNILEFPKKYVFSKHKIILGDRMYTRDKDLLRSKSERIKYTPQGIKR